MLYAFNPPEDGALRRPALRDFSPITPNLRIQRGDLGGKGRCLVIVARPGVADEEAAEVIRAALGNNKPAMAIPTTPGLWFRVWLPMICLVCVAPLAITFAYMVGGPIVAGLDAILQLAALYFCYRLTVQVAMGPSIPY